MTTHAKALAALLALAALSAATAYAAIRIHRKRNPVETETATDSPLDLTSLRQAKDQANATTTLTTPATMQYFTLSELIRSRTAQQHGIDNTPDAEQQRNLEALTINVLDPARQAYGAPVYVTSGYRCKTLNDLLVKEADAAENSQHLRGEAADLSTGSPEGNIRLGDIIRQQGRFDQLIYEKCNAARTQCQWIHVSYKRTGTNRKEVLPQ